MLIQEDFLNKNHLLVVDDDDRIRELLQRYLKNNNYFVCIASNVEEAEKYMKKYIFDMMILDVMMPNESGIDFLKRFRNEDNSNIPVLMLTALGETNNKIDGLESGADDYLVKPFEPKELLLRIKNILSRVTKNNKTDKIIKFGNFSFNLINSKLKNEFGDIYLTDMDRNLLELFCKNPNKLYTREDLSKMFNGISERSIDVQINRLRKKIEKNQKQPIFLQTVRNKGYVFNL